MDKLTIDLTPMGKIQVKVNDHDIGPLESLHLVADTDYIESVAKVCIKMAKIPADLEPNLRKELMERQLDSKTKLDKFYPFVEVSISDQLPKLIDSEIETES